MPKSKEFISSSESDSDSEPRKKKKKTEKPAPKPEKPKAASKDSEENMFQLSKMRYASVSEFRGKVLVGIREYYEVDGEMRPGKKGISLSKEQWDKLKENMAEIDKVIDSLS